MSKMKTISYNQAIKDFRSPVRLKKDNNGNANQFAYAEWINDASEVEMLHVRDFKTLIQVIGKAKYSESLKANGGAVLFFRGQARFYGTKLQPSVYRTLRRNKSKVDAKVESEVNQFIRLAGANIEKLSPVVVEGLFQQYEKPSRWIDVVDNIWIALWFACHDRWEESGRVVYVRRQPSKEKDHCRYAYILLLGAVQGERLGAGYWKSQSCEYLDLRCAVPSQYLRPHVQHGILIRKLNKQGLPAEDMTGLVKGIIRIDLEDALHWLGEAESLSVPTLFPGPMFDTGFRDILEDCEKAKMGATYNFR